MNTQSTHGASHAPAAHTPTPWTINNHAYANTIQSASGSAICSMIADVYMRERQETIVRAVNSHASLVAINAELVEQLRLTQAMIENLRGDIVAGRPMHQGAIQLGLGLHLNGIRAVLARAEAMKKEGGM